MAYYREGPTTFPPGTQVGLYSRLEWPPPAPQDPEGEPPLAPLEVVEADESGGLTLRDLEWNYAYWLAAEVEGEWLYEGITLPPFQPWTPHELKDMIGALEVRVKALEEA